MTLECLLGGRTLQVALVLHKEWHGVLARQGEPSKLVLELLINRNGVKAIVMTL